MPFQTGRFRRLKLAQSELVAKFPCSAASLHCPESGGSRQPLHRQVRYYSERRICGKWRFGSFRGTTPQNSVTADGNSTHKCQKRHSLGVAPRTCTGHWPLGIFGGSYPPASAVTRPVSLDGAAHGGGSCRVLRSFGLPDLIPGSLLHHWHPLYSNSVPFDYAYIFSITYTPNDGSMLWNLGANPLSCFQKP